MSASATLFLDLNRKDFGDTIFANSRGSYFAGEPHSLSTSGDGRTMSGTISNPVLVGQDFRCVKATVRYQGYPPSANNNFGYDSVGPVFFDGYAPPPSPPPDKTAPVSTARAGGSRNGSVAFAVADNSGGSGPKFIHYRLDGGSVRTVTTSGNPGAATVILPQGRHILQYWGEDAAGNQEAVHHRMTITVDRTAPVVRIRSLQHRTHYRRGQRASIIITASDALSGLKINPSRRLRLSTRRLGRFTRYFTAVDKAGNRQTVAFRYTVTR